MNKLAALILLVVAASPLARAASSPDAAVRRWREQHEQQVLDEFVALLRIPNVSGDTANVRRNADFLLERLKARGIDAKPYVVEGANPIVLGTIPVRGAKRTLAFYAHYDGQPVDAKQWSNPPFEPTLRSAPIERGGAVVPPKAPVDREARLYARGAADDKLSVMALLAAIDALRATGAKLNSNIKLVFEGEEEAGSPNLAKILAANKAAFAADWYLMVDGPVHASGRPIVAFGARDIVWLELSVYGPAHDVHSGHYGNWVPNPAFELARLLAAMKDEHGRVLVPHFYDEVEPLGPREKQALAEAPDADAALMDELAIGSTEAAPRRLAEAITQPSLNIKGLASAHVGADSANVVPATATASIDIRLVKGMDPARTLDRVTDFVRSQGFFVVDAEPGAEIRRAHTKVARIDRSRTGFGAVRTPMDDPFAQDVVRTIERVRAAKAVLVPNLGGSLPLSDVERPLGARTIVIPLANHDDRQHAADENLRIGNLWDAIETLEALLRL